MHKLYVFLAAMMAIAGASAFNVYVNDSGGSRLYQSDSLESMIFGTDGNVTIVNTDGTSVEIAADDFRSLTFTQPTGVDAVSENGAYSLDGNQLVAASSVTICDMNGRVAVSASDGRVDLTLLAPGVYLVTIDGVTSKLLVK